MKATFVSHPVNGMLYYSDKVWIDPPTGVLEQPRLWAMIDPDDARVLRTYLPNMLPESSGEYAVLDYHLEGGNRGEIAIAERRRKAFHVLAATHGEPDETHRPFTDYMNTEYRFIGVQDNLRINSTFYTGGDTVGKVIDRIISDDFDNAEVPDWNAPVIYDLDTGDCWTYRSTYVIRTMPITESDPDSNPLTRMREESDIG